MPISVLLPLFVVFSQFFPDDNAKRIRQRLFIRLYVFPQRPVDQTLIISATGFVDLGSKLFKNIIIKSNGYARLSRRSPDNCASYSATEVIFFFHRNYLVYAIVSFRLTIAFNS